MLLHSIDYTADKQVLCWCCPPWLMEKEDQFLQVAGVAQSSQLLAEFFEAPFMMKPLFPLLVDNLTSSRSKLDHTRPHSVTLKKKGSIETETRVALSKSNSRREVKFALR